MSSVWQVIQDYWLIFLIGSYPRGPLGGLAATVALIVLGLGLAFPCGILLALGRTSRHQIINQVSTAIVIGIRSIPFLMVIFWSYFLLPIMIGRVVSGFTTLVGALIVYQGAYFAEIIRAGILTVPKGQLEAAAALSLSPRVVTWRIILPQALRTMLPSLISQAVAGMKETSLGYVISVHEVTFSAQQINSMAINKPLEVFFVLAMIFFALCFSLSLWARLLERKMAKQGRT